MVKRYETLISLFRSSSVVEHSAVNRAVVGSNPTCGAIYGELSEWSKEHDWKSCRRDERLKGSNPLLSASHLGNNIWPVGQVVKTPPFHGGNTGSNPVRVIFYGGLAQLGEHLPYKQGVGGSIPSSSTIDKKCFFLSSRGGAAR